MHNALKILFPVYSNVALVLPHTLGNGLADGCEELINQQISSKAHVGNQANFSGRLWFQKSFYKWSILILINCQFRDKGIAGMIPDHIFEGLYGPGLKGKPIWRTQEFTLITNIQDLISYTVPFVQ